MATAVALAPSLPYADSIQILIVEGVAGNARRLWLERRLHEIAPPGARVWVVSCDVGTGGPWAGAKELFENLFPVIQEKRPDLVQKHALELAYVMPQLRRSLTLRTPALTDLAPHDGDSRRYAAGHALHIVHGLIDLLDSWKSTNDAEAPWIIACDSYCQAGVMVSRFFSQLIRRRGKKLDLRLLLAVDPGQAVAIRASFGATAPAEVTAVGSVRRTTSNPDA